MEDGLNVATVDAPAIDTPIANDSVSADTAAAPVVEASAAAATASWADLIKDVPVTDLLKTKGLDEKVVKLIDHYQAKGNIDNYIKAYSTNYDAMPDDQLLKLKIERDYADFSEEEREDIFNAEADRYKLDAELYSEAETRRGKTLLKADIAAFRKQLNEERESLLITGAPQEPQTGVDAQAISQQYQEMLTKSEAYSGLATSGVLKVGAGEAAFNMDVDKDALLAYLTNDEAYAKAHLDEQGKPDFARQLRIAAAATDPNYEQKLIDHGRKLATIQMATGLGNESLGTTNTGRAEDLSPAEKLALKMYGGR